MPAFSRNFEQAGMPAVPGTQTKLYASKSVRSQWINPQS